MAASMPTSRSCGPASCSYHTERGSAAPMRAPRLRRRSASRTACAGMKADKAQMQLQDVLATHTQRLERLLQAAPPAVQLHRELAQELRHLKQALAAAAPEASSAAATVADAHDPRALAVAMSQDLAQLQQGLMTEGGKRAMGTTGKADCMDDESSSSSSSSSSEDEEERMQRKQEKRQRKLEKEQRKMEKKAAKQKMKGRDMATCATGSTATGGTASTSPIGSGVAVLERPLPTLDTISTMPTSSSNGSGSSSTAMRPNAQAAPMHLPVPELWTEHETPVITPAQLPEGATGRVLVCQGSKCARVGAHGVLQEASAAVGGAEGVEVLPCKCLGKCKMGPAMRVRPQGHKGTTFTHVAPGQVGGLVEQAFAAAAVAQAAAESAAAAEQPVQPVAAVEFGQAVQAAPVF